MPSRDVMLPPLMTPIELISTRGRVSNWLSSIELPLWNERGIGRNFLFHEQLDFSGKPLAHLNRRTRVQARQLYCFHQASLLGWEVLPAILENGVRNFEKFCWARDGKPGWVHLLDPAGAVVDPKRDAYDHAFALFALAWAFKSTGEARARELADQTLAFMDAEFADPAGGYQESLPFAQPRRSNPHMHFLEAMLAWLEATGEATFRDRANTIIELFRARFFDPVTGTLGEYFEDGWKPAAGEAGQLVEPGHHFEWAWLLVRAAEAGCHDATAEARRLYQFGLHHGLDRSGFAIDECDRSGRQLRQSRRAWPQTELIKAHIAMGKVDAAAKVAERFLDTYLATEVPGLWMDQFDAQGDPMTQAVPASTLYHVVVAFRELLNAA